MLFLAGLWACTASRSDNAQPVPTAEIFPVVTTDKVPFDTDDPAIWVNPKDAAASLIIGTDKGGKTGDGGIFVFDLKGKNLAEKNILNLQRPNNVDVAYGLETPGGKMDIAVCTERNTNRIRVIAVPDMKLTDGEGIPVFEGETERSPMGIALYTNPSDRKIYAIVGRKSGPADGYLYQYFLQTAENGRVEGKLVRKFGRYSGTKEIESIAVDNELGYVYYSDEGVGVRKYYVHPDSSDRELALFATSGVQHDHEGLSIYKSGPRTGYILLSDQQANRFHIFPRQGTKGGPHKHPLLKIIKTQTTESDGSDVTNVPLNATFRRGMFVAMSADRTFQYYRWEDVAGKDLK